MSLARARLEKIAKAQTAAADGQDILTAVEHTEKRSFQGCLPFDRRRAPETAVAPTRPQ